MSGCAVMSASCLSSSSMRCWHRTCAVIPPSAFCSRPADRGSRSSTTAISTPAITLSSQSTGSATSKTPRLRPWSHPKSSARSARANPDSLPQYCRKCEFLFTCHGECPKNRVLTTPDGEPGLNWLCAGLKAFYAHTERPMRIMAELLKRGRYADEIMPMLAAEEATTLKKAFASSGRNDPCPCGSGRKFKRCHGGAMPATGETRFGKG